MAALAWSAYCCGVSPVKLWTFSAVITVLAGIGERPAATTRLSRSTPMSGYAGAAGHGTPPPALSVGRVAGQVVGEAPAWETAEQRNAGYEGRRSVEPARKHHVLNDSLIGAAERRDVARQPQAELIVVEAETPAHDGIRRDRPGGAQTRREVLLVREFRIVVPAQTEIERQIVEQSPVVLREERGVVVAQMNLVVLRRESSGVSEQIGDRRWRRRIARSRRSSQTADSAEAARRRRRPPSAGSSCRPSDRGCPTSLLMLPLNAAYCWSRFDAVRILPKETVGRLPKMMQVAAVHLES